MDAGKLDRRVTLQRLGPPTDDGFTTLPGSWANLAIVWGQFLPIRAFEKAEAGETAAFRKVSIRIRKDSAWADLNAKDRLLLDGSTYNITDVNEPKRGEFVVDAIARGDS